MKKITIFAIIVAPGAVAALLLGSQARETGKVCNNNNCFNVELARSGAKQQIGLMFRQSLPESEGMLFIFKSNAAHQFWMKNTLIPLDIIWINEGKEVVFMEQNVLPCSSDPCEVFNPGLDAKYVLEINAGAAERTGLRIGEKLRFE